MKEKIFKTLLIAGMDQSRRERALGKNNPSERTIAHLSGDHRDKMIANYEKDGEFAYDAPIVNIFDDEITDPIQRPVARKKRDEFPT